MRNSLGHRHEIGFVERGLLCQAIKPAGHLFDQPFVAHLVERSRVDADSYRLRSPQEPPVISEVVYCPTERPRT